jgi:carboxypeptidase PM20D1
MTILWPISFKLMRKIAIILLLTSHIAFAQSIDKVVYNGSLISIEHLLQKYVQIPSVSGNEKIAGEFIKSIAKENGLFISDFGSKNGNYNFAASIFPLKDKKPNIVFLNHIDVVPEIDDLNPYSGEIKNNKVIGRGAIDNKGNALMQLFSIIAYFKSESKISDAYNISFLAVSCEETQCSGGIDYVLEHHLEELNPAVVIGEGPSELTSLLEGEFNNPIFGISVVHKRLLWLNLELEIETFGHSSITPIHYANQDMVCALNSLTSKKNKIVYNKLNINILKTLGNQKKGIKKLILKNPRLFKFLIVPQLRKQPELLSLFTNTITLTNIASHNDSYNILPTNATAHLDCRLLPETNEKEFLTLINKRLKNSALKVSVVESTNACKPTSIETLFYENLAHSITSYYPKSEILPLLIPNINDLGAFRARGILAYASIPVIFSRKEVESIHSRNESISIPLLYDGAQVHFNFLKRMQNETRPL